MSVTDFLLDDNLTEEEWIEGYQGLIDSGLAWKLEGSVGRTAMNLIERGFCTLGKESHIDSYGNKVPSRYEVKPGTKGSLEYVQDKMGEGL